MKKTCGLCPTILNKKECKQNLLCSQEQKVDLTLWVLLDTESQETFGSEQGILGKYYEIIE